MAAMATVDGRAAKKTGERHGVSPKPNYSRAQRMAVGSRPDLSPRACILVVDDEAGIARNISRLLAQHFSWPDEFYCLHFTSGTSLLEWLRRNRDRSNVAMVLADHVLGTPGMTGMDVLRKVAKLSPSTKRVLFSARATIEDYIRAVNESLLDAAFLKLDFIRTPSGVFARLRAVLESWQENFNRCKGTCFVIMPFGGVEDRVYHELIRPAVESLHFRSVRQDERKTINKHIIDDIVQNIRNATFLICDITGSNPNVFFELGIAQSLRKPVLLFTRSLSNCPFDVRSFRIARYNSRSRSCLAIKREICGTLSAIMNHEVT